MSEQKDRESGRIGSSEVASKGGKARAKALTPEQRREIAAKGGAARAEKSGAKLPRATHSGPLRIGDIEFDCAVVRDGDRVLRLVSETNFMKAMGMYRSGALSTRREKDDTGALTPLFLAHKNLRPFAERHLQSLQLVQVKYITTRGAIAGGIPDEVIPKICEIWIDADREGALGARQKVIAAKADMLLRAFAQVGIRALIDEATGYQYDRPRKDLEEYLSQYLADSLRRWVRTFPAEYFRELCRLRGVDLRPDMRLPQYFGTLTNNLVYRRIAPGILKGLKNRRAERGNRSDKLHSWLSEDVGVREVLVHLGVVVGLMSVNNDYATFEKQLDRVAPIYPDTPGLFDDPEDWEERSPTKPRARKQAR